MKDGTNGDRWRRPRGIPPPAPLDGATVRASGRVDLHRRPAGRSSLATTATLTPRRLTALARRRRPTAGGSLAVFDGLRLRRDRPRRLPASAQAPSSRCPMTHPTDLSKLDFRLHPEELEASIDKTVKDDTAAIGKDLLRPTSPMCLTARGPRLLRRRRRTRWRSSCLRLASHERSSTARPAGSPGQDTDYMLISADGTRRQDQPPRIHRGRPPGARRPQDTTPPESQMDLRSAFKIGTRWRTTACSRTR